MTQSSTYVSRIRCILAYSSSRLAQYSYEILPNLFYSSDLVNLQSYAAGY